AVARLPDDLDERRNRPPAAPGRRDSDEGALLCEGGVHGYISNRSASTGGSSAARRAGYVEVTTPITTSVAIATSPDCHDRIIPAKRSGIGARLTSRHSPNATAMPPAPPARVRKKPPRKTCR